jgi:two-component system phosphate regulon response regulator PhoB/two-component system alkaline phosphatase synthesis response regulator PhoP
MPKADGYKIIKFLKSDQKTKTIPVILLSNLGEKEDITKGILLGAEDYIPKINFTPDEVVEKINTFLKND